jgi:ribosome-binding factor A
MSGGKATRAVDSVGSRLQGSDRKESTMSLRIERLKEVIREESAETITQDLSDPRLGFCTVTKIELTNDLAYCTVHVSVIGDDGVKTKTMHALKAARGLIQAKIAKRLKTRTTPHVDIALDESMEKAFGVLEKIKEARAKDSDGGKGSEPSEEPDDDVEVDEDEDEAPKMKRKKKK